MSEPAPKAESMEGTSQEPPHVQRLRRVGAPRSPNAKRGFALWARRAVLWLFVLAKAEVSFAYPFVAVGFLLVMTFGALYLGENVTWMRGIGTVLVVCGVLLVARS